MKNQKLLFYLMLLFSSSVFAQITISGKVLDEGGFPLPGANIVEVGTENGASTDFDGTFKLTTESDSGKISISFIGYKNQELLFSPTIKEFKNVQMTLSSDLLSEVVLVGYKKKTLRDATEAVVKIRDVNNKLSTRPIMNTEEILQGNATGVTVLNRGGDPTNKPEIKIRGLGSLNSESPLVVVDGVPELPMPNPSDIESITVLKDASASIYGARASGGVILVTTKKGSKKDTKVNLNVYSGFTSIAKRLKPLTTQEYVDVRRIALKNDGKSDTSPAMVTLNEYEKKWKNQPDTNWFDAIFRKGFVLNYDLSFSGGGEKSVFFAGINHRKTEGILLNSNFQKSTLRLNSEFEINEKFTIGENLAITYSDGAYGINTTNTHDGVIFSALSAPSKDPIRNKDGEYSKVSVDVPNPVRYLEERDVKAPTTNISGNVFLKYDFIDNLSFKSSLGGVKELYNVREYKKPGDKNKSHYLTITNYDFLKYNIENTISYSNVFNEKHSLDILVGQSAEKNYGTYFYGKKMYKSEAKIDEDLRFLDYDISVSKRYAGGKSYVNNSLLSFVGRLDYSFDKKYYLTGIVRRDGSSKLGPNNRWGTFPSVLASWRVSNEDFMKGASWLDELKIRASYGIMGNVGSLREDFGYKRRVGENKAHTVVFQGDITHGYALINPGNPNLRWERSIHTNVGLDGAFLNNNLYFTFDYFIKKTEGMLIQVPSAAQTGYTQIPYTNAGAVENKGFEALIGYKNSSKKDFSYDVSANFSIVRNKVTDLADGKFISGGSTRRHKDIFRSVVGKPIRSFYLIKSDGIFESEEAIKNHKDKDGNLIQPNAKVGDLKFIDKNGDGKISVEDKQFVGSAFPDLSFGLNFKADYKGIELSMLWQGVLGKKTYNALKETAYYPHGQGFNLLSYAKDAWSKNNTGSDVPRLTIEDKNGNLKASDWFLEDASYARLKNITLAYNIPTGLFKNKLFASKVYITAKNLLTITKYSGLDPENNPNGIDVGYYPNYRSFILGANIQF